MESPVQEYVYSNILVGSNRSPEDLVLAGGLIQRRKFGCAPVRVGGILLFLITIPSLLAQEAGFHHAPSSAAARKNPLAGEHTAVAAGATVYASKCSKCHGVGGHGTGIVPSLAKGRAQKAKAGELFWFITQGDEDNGMPSWTSLSDKERWQVVTYIKSLGALDKSRAKGKQ